MSQEIIAAIGTPLVVASLDKTGQLGITVTVSTMDRIAVLRVDNLKFASSC